MPDGGSVLARLLSAVPSKAKPAADALLVANLDVLAGLLEALAEDLKVPEPEVENFWDLDAPRVERGRGSDNQGRTAPPPPPATLDPWSALFCLAALGPLPVLEFVEQKLRSFNVELLGLMDQEGNSALNIAVMGDKLDCVRHLIATVPGLCLRHNWRKELPIQLAVRDSCPEIVQEILRGSHAKTSTRIDEQGNTVFMFAVAQQRTELVQFLLDNTPSGEASIAKCNHDGESALMVAARAGCLPLVRLLLARGAEMGQDDSANNVLHHAVRSTSVEVVRCLAFQTPDSINEVNDEEETPLHLAPLVSCSADLLCCLLDAKGDPSVPDCDGCNTLHRAIRAKNLDCVTELCRRGCELEARTAEGLTALLTAAKYATYEIVEYLMKQGADCEAQDARGQTALHLSLSEPGPMGLELVRGGRFALEQRDMDGMTPFLVAARYGELATVEYLAEVALVDTEAKDKEGDSALGLAVVGCRLELLPYLLSISSCLGRNASGQTPAILAARYSPPEVLLCLIEAEADISVRDVQGYDCVMSAVLGGNLPCLQVLVSSGCAVTAVSNEGETALLLSLRANHEPIIQFLMQIPERHTTMLHVLPKNVIEAVISRDRLVKKCPPGKQGDRRRQEIYETKEELLETWKLPDVVVAKVCYWNSRKLERRGRQERRLKPSDSKDDS